MFSSTTATEGDKMSITEESFKMKDPTLLDANANKINGASSAMTSTVTTAATTTTVTKTKTTRGPCSNDNPDWELETLPCLGKDEIFDGALSTRAASTTTPAADVTSISTATSATTATTSATLAEKMMNESFDATPPGAVTTFTATTIPTAVTATSSATDKTAQAISPTSSTSFAEDDLVPAIALPLEEHPSFFSCNATSREDFGTVDGSDENAGNFSPLYLRYNYEIYTPTDAEKIDITNILAKFENDLTYGVAHSLGLTDCPQSGGNIDSSVEELNNAEISLKQVFSEHDSFGEEKAGGSRKARYLTHQNSRYYVRRSLHSVITAEDSLNHLPKRRELGNPSVGSTGVLGLSMEPSDEIDNTLLRCTSTVELDLLHKCTPVHGFLTAWFNSSQQQRLRRGLMSGDKEDMLLTIIENYIKQNKTDYLTADANSNSTNQLYHVELVGEREISIGMINPEVLARPVPQESKVAIGNEDNGGFKAGIIGIASAAALLVIIAIGVVWTTRHKRSRRARQDDDEAEFDSRGVASPKGLGSPSSSEFGRGSWSADEEDGSFPTADHAGSTVANRSGSFDSGVLVSPRLSLVENESDDDDNFSFSSSTPYQQNENVPNENLFGLSPGDRSDLTTSSTPSQSDTVVASNIGAFDTAPVLKPKATYLVETVNSDDSISVLQGDNGGDGVSLGSLVSDEHADQNITEETTVSLPSHGPNDADVDAYIAVQHANEVPEQVLRGPSADNKQQASINTNEIEKSDRLDNLAPSVQQGNDAEHEDGEADDGSLLHSSSMHLV
mmetsp:Transcript_24578/g.50601  ORF Transcript_24578/g.50601 Transcript_24578/m.50601 type:complete len:789 (+) Transcript_24578:2-2368(+)